MISVVMVCQPVAELRLKDAWALRGAYFIFGWLDVVENMSSVIFNSEDACHRFVSQLRTKISPYLLRCVALLLEVLDERDQDTDFAIDLHDRLGYYTGARMARAVRNLKVTFIR
jgi:hypothetical protein